MSHSHQPGCLLGPDDLQGEAPSMWPTKCQEALSICKYAAGLKHFQHAVNTPESTPQHTAVLVGHTTQPCSQHLTLWATTLSPAPPLFHVQVASRSRLAGLEPVQRCPALFASLAMSRDVTPFQHSEAARCELQFEIFCQDEEVRAAHVPSLVGPAPGEWLRAHKAAI